MRSERLVAEAVRVDGDALWLAGVEVALASVRRLAVVGGGKAGAGMAVALERALGADLVERLELTGWVNVPADCVRPTERIRLHAARPAGVNEPRPEGAEGTRRILEIAAGLGPDDLCVSLISGGGSALLPAPAPGLALADKLAVTRLLSAGGADIAELNTVRKQLSAIKGGGLARACGAGQLVSLIISDVLGDPLDLIASGPTVPDPGTPQRALAVLERFGAREAGIRERVFDHLHAAPSSPLPPSCTVHDRVIGNLSRAAEAAAAEARQLGYDVTVEVAAGPEGPAEGLGRDLAADAEARRSRGGRRCLVSGGEPTVTLVDEARRGRGGRNQQLVLAGLQALRDWRGAALLSGGTDGEDGPTDAAGAFVDGDVAQAARERGLDAADHLARNDAYRFFDTLGALIRTGPTHTNVCDLRIVLTEGER